MVWPVTTVRHLHRLKPRLRQVTQACLSAGISKKPCLLIQIGLSSAVVVLFTLLILYFYDGDREYYRLYYFVPVSVPAVLFIFDRLSRREQLGFAGPFIDSLIAIVSLVRVYRPIPFYSGHALFLSFLLFTTKSRVCLIAGILVLMQTAYIKLFIWDHDYSLYGGVIIGYLISLIHRRFIKKEVVTSPQVMSPAEASTPKT